jgi:hypothetical protein
MPLKDPRWMLAHDIPHIRIVSAGFKWVKVTGSTGDQVTGWAECHATKADIPLPLGK